MFSTEEQKDYRDAYLSILRGWLSSNRLNVDDSDKEIHKMSLLFVDRMKEIRKQYESNAIGITREQKYFEKTL